MLLAGASVALCVVVLVSGAKAPSTTPYLAMGASAAASGGAGAVLQLAKRKVPLKPAARAAIVLGVAFLTLLPAGALRYTYGSEGSLAITLSASPLSLNFGTPSSITGEISLYNDGATTVRVLPSYEVRVTDPSGLPRPQVWDGCTIPAPPAPTERALVEVPPGGLIHWSFTLSVAWADQSGAATPCGAVLLSSRGIHNIAGSFESHGFPAFALVPVWTNLVTSERAALTVH